MSLRLLEVLKMKGKWQLTEIVTQGRKHSTGECELMIAYYCDNCGYTQYHTTPYCPWCGAKMELETD